MACDVMRSLAYLFHITQFNTSDPDGIRTTPKILGKTGVFSTRQREIQRKRGFNADKRRRQGIVADGSDCMATSEPERQDGGTGDHSSSLREPQAKRPAESPRAAWSLSKSWLICYPNHCLTHAHRWAIAPPSCCQGTGRGKSQPRRPEGPAKAR